MPDGSSAEVTALNGAPSWGDAEQPGWRRGVECTGTVLVGEHPKGTSEGPEVGPSVKGTGREAHGPEGAEQGRIAGSGGRGQPRERSNVRSWEWGAVQGKAEAAGARRLAEPPEPRAIAPRRWGPGTAAEGVEGRAEGAVPRAESFPE